MGDYQEFDNICFVDTLEHTSFDGKQGNLFALSVENTERIKRQNDRTISVIIGNPPYNAKQENFNQNNSNRTYSAIDKRIKDSYIKYGKAQNQIVIYDMYTRFLRWASDRLGKNGIVAFVSNNSFLDALAYDGFRKVVAKEFSEIYIIDMKGNARTSGERRKQEGGNVFSDEIRVGIAVYFLVRNENTEGFKVFCNSIRDYAKAEEKKEYFIANKLKNLNFIHAIPDKDGNWINQADNDFDTLLPLVDKDVKGGKAEQAVFKSFSSGIKTHRDEWVYDLSKESLVDKMKFFVEVYQKEFNQQALEEFSQAIKWDEDLRSYFRRGINKVFDEQSIKPSLYRPFYKEYLYFDKHFNGRTYQWLNIYQQGSQNYYICLPGIGASKPFQSLMTNKITCLDFLEKTQCLPLYRYDKDGKRIDNITDWGLEQFQNHYNGKTITKLDIFHYTYAVLHNPA